MNTYEKLTLEKFKANLDAGKYQNLTGARRAIGKADWSESDKDKGRTFAEKHFGESGVTKAKIKTGSKKGVVKAAKQQATVTASRPKNTRSSGSVSSKDILRLEDLTVSQAIISSCSVALDALARAKAADHMLDISEAQIAVGLIIKAVDNMDRLLGGKPTTTVSAPATMSSDSFFATNGASEMQEDPLFARPPATD